MASSEDLVQSGVQDALRQVIPVFDTAEVILVVAALVWLDRRLGVDSAENVIVISEEFSLWLPLLTTFTDPEILEMMRQPAQTSDHVADAHLMERFEAALARPFEVEFTDPKGQYVYPVIDGLRRTIWIDPTLPRHGAYTIIATRR